MRAVAVRYSDGHAGVIAPIGVCARLPSILAESLGTPEWDIKSAINPPLNRATPSCSQCEAQRIGTMAPASSRCSSIGGALRRVGTSPIWVTHARTSPSSHRPLDTLANLAER